MSTLTWLRVHSQRIADADDAIRVSQSAYCPARRGFVSLSTCSTCANLFAIDRRDRDAYLVCDVAGGNQVPFAEVVKQAPSNPRDEPPAVVADAMHADVICVEPDVTVPALLQLLATHGISGVPVVKRGRAIGVVSKSDVVRTLSQTLGAQRQMVEMTVEEIMSPLVFSVAPDMLLERAAVVPGDVVMLFTDGLKSDANLAEELALMREHPLLMAHHLFTRYRRGHDDALVAVIRV